MTRYQINFTDQPDAKARYRTALKLMGAQDIRIEEKQMQASTETLGPSKPKKDNLPTSEEAKAVATLFKRRLDTEWADEEIKAFKSSVKTGLLTLETMKEVANYYRKNRSNEKAFLRTSILTFCRHFGTELDKARNGQPEPSKKGEWLDSNKVVPMPQGEEEQERIRKSVREEAEKLRKELRA